MSKPYHLRTCELIDKLVIEIEEEIERAADGNYTKRRYIVLEYLCPEHEIELISFQWISSNGILKVCIPIF